MKKNNDKNKYLIRKKDNTSIIQFHFISQNIKLQ
jgi:hypothetical protein